MDYAEQSLDEYYISFTPLLPFRRILQLEALLAIRFLE